MNDYEQMMGRVLDTQLSQSEQMQTLILKATYHLRDGGVLGPFDSEQKAFADELAEGLLKVVEYLDGLDEEDA